jgi:hypothetical protein
MDDTKLKQIESGVGTKLLAKRDTNMILSNWHMRQCDAVIANADDEAFIEALRSHASSLKSYRAGLSLVPQPSKK